MKDIKRDVISAFSFIPRNEILKINAEEPIWKGQVAR